jgi:hypothetical protein
MNNIPKEYDAFKQLLGGVLNEINTRNKFMSEPIDLDTPTKLAKFAANQILMKPSLLNEHILLKSDTYSRDELAALNSWKAHAIRGTFAVFDKAQQNFVLMKTDKSEMILYGACSPTLVNGLDEAPYAIEAVLLPFRDKIFFECFVEPTLIQESKKALLRAYYKHSKETYRIALSLPANENALWRNISWQKPNYIPNYLEIKDLLIARCASNLGEDMLFPCLIALGDLAGLKPCPLLSGRAKSWACAIMCAVGSNNGLISRYKPARISASALASIFDISVVTMKLKAKQIRAALNMGALSYTASPAARNALNIHAEADDFKDWPELCEVDIPRQ